MKLLYCCCPMCKTPIASALAKRAGTRRRGLMWSAVAPHTTRLTLREARIHLPISPMLPMLARRSSGEKRCLHFQHYWWITSVIDEAYLPQNLPKLIQCWSGTQVNCRGLHVILPVMQREWFPACRDTDIIECLAHQFSMSYAWIMRIDLYYWHLRKLKLHSNRWLLSFLSNLLVIFWFSSFLILK